jgi:hypothetical protein
MSILDQTQDATLTLFVYETIKRICKKYRTMFRCDELYLEINFMVEVCFKKIVTTAKQCF